MATQDERLRKDHFTGLPEMAMNYFRFVAEDVRQWLAKLGVNRLQDLIGRTDLLELAEGQQPRQRGLDLRPILAASGMHSDTAQYCTESRNHPRDPGTLAARMLA